MLRPSYQYSGPSRLAIFTIWSIERTIGSSPRRQQIPPLCGHNSTPPSTTDSTPAWEAGASSYLFVNWQAFGCEPNALPRQQLIDKEKVRDSPTLDLQAFRKAEIPASLRSND